ncbi:four helix bundle protein [Psychroflexus halocasei]|uniref:Four helix bundle protein n=1 Tax=Psychroflexus halocasei TaxID=908615 RepID=A0A1H4DAF4_9FLAO|nr:four helix bundle protein [Psychroflexus halocasei]
MSISKGSAGELRSQFFRALDIDVINQTEFEELNMMTTIIGKQLGAFMNYLKSTTIKGKKFSEPSEDYELLS